MRWTWFAIRMEELRNAKIILVEKTEVKIPLVRLKRR
jgi:hypothetical protein